jgi:DNA-binding NarL/FixJ family response regulator
MTTVLIVAAYASTRAGLDALLEGCEACSVVGAVSGSRDMQIRSGDGPPDVVLAEFQSSDAPAVLELAAAWGAGVVLLGETGDGYRLLLDYPLRGWAYLLRDADSADIAAACAGAAAGLVVLGRSLFPLGGVPMLTGTPAQPTGARIPGDGPAVDPLTAREREVLEWMARGLANKQIAARLNISLHTVKFHVASLLMKLGASSRTEAVATGARRGLIAL